jgi:hypothetical protein
MMLFMEYGIFLRSIKGNLESNFMYRNITKKPSQKMKRLLYIIQIFSSSSRRTILPAGQLLLKVTVSSATASLLFLP